MRTRSLTLASVLALGLPVSAQAADAQTFTVRDGLTSKTELRGTVRLAPPSGWRLTAGGGRHSYARYRIVAGQCRLDLTVSVRGKATRRSVRAQVADAVGKAPLGDGIRTGGAWGINGPDVSGGEGEPLVAGLYGIASMRVAANRYGQLRIQGSVRGCDTGAEDAKALLARDGAAVRGVRGVLKAAKPSLRVASTA